MKTSILKFYYKCLCFIRLDKVKRLLVHIMDVVGENYPFSAEMSYLEVFQRISKAYPRGIKYEDDLSEIKLLYSHLCDVESELNRVKKVRNIE